MSDRIPTDKEHIDYLNDQLARTRRTIEMMMATRQSDERIRAELDLSRCRVMKQNELLWDIYQCAKNSVVTENLKPLEESIVKFEQEPYQSTL